MPQGQQLEGLVRADIAVGTFERDRNARIGLGFASGPDRVELVGLALVTVLGLRRGPRRTHIAYVMTVADQEHARVPTESARALDAPTQRPARTPSRPGLHRTMTVARHAERLRAQHAATFIEHRRGQRPLMRIHPNDVGRLANRALFVSIVSPSLVPLDVVSWRGPVDTSPFRDNAPIKSDRSRRPGRGRHFCDRTPAYRVGLALSQPPARLRPYEANTPHRWTHHNTGTCPFR